MIGDWHEEKEGKEEEEKEKATSIGLAQSGHLLGSITEIDH